MRITMTGYSEAPQWSDLTPEKICDELRVLTKRVRQMKAQQPSGIIIMAGEAAHATIRHTFPEDTETVKIKPCRYLKPDQCLIIENRLFQSGKGFSRMEMMEAGNMTKDLKISESYIVGVDISENKDLSVLTVSRLDGTKMTVVNTFMGAEAEEMYEHLTG